jgi:subtilisin family serine protease
MQSVVRPIRSIALAAILTAGGCTPANHTRASDPLVASAGRSIRTTVPTAYMEARTVSFALDRIDQRTLPLDRLYKHFGTGHGITVYVFDGGVLETHPELAGRVRRGFDAFPNEAHLCNAHGTAVAGAIGGATLGVAPDVEIVDIKMVECRRMRGTIDAIVHGAHWVMEDVARHPGRRAIANWSFIADTSAGIPALDSAVQELREAGIPVVVSAGNVEIDACRIAPGNAPGALVVGASRVHRADDRADGPLADERAPGTAFGRCIDVFAPGDSVLLPSMDSRRGATEQLWTGTSMAAGYVSGAIALFLEAHPYASPDAVTEHILGRASRATTVDPRSPETGMLYVGGIP